MKVYLLLWSGEKSFIAAFTIIQALQVYCEENELDLFDLESTDEIEEFPKHRWNAKINEFMLASDKPAVIYSTI